MSDSPDGFNDKADSSSRAVRETENKGDARNPFARDRDRVLYSREFRRLSNVTQVARTGESYLFHDRLTHSLKVAQVGRRLAQLLLKRQSDDADENMYPLTADDRPHPDVVEAACLAHDLGHPPFGHVVEKTLNKEVEEKTEGAIGFEGNAQSFRIVTKLASHRYNDRGLNLTRATLNALQKYPQSRKENDEKWGYYPSERNRFQEIRSYLPENCGLTLEADVMDYADDLTYAIHDVADFYQAGLIPLDRLLYEARRREEADDDLPSWLEPAEETSVRAKPELDAFCEYVDENEDIDATYDDTEQTLQGVAGLPAVMPPLFTPFRNTDDDADILNAFTSHLIARYLEASPEYISVNRETDVWSLEVDDTFEKQIAILKELTRYYVINNPTLVQQQRGHQSLIKELYQTLYKEAESDDFPQTAIPSPYRERLMDDPDDPPSEWENSDVSVYEIQQSRQVADIIASMTERQAVDLHKRLIGDTPGSIRDEIIQ